MRALAECLNEELCALLRQRQTYYQGNLELKEAVTNISHDIRTPLTAIRGYLELLEDEEKTENTIRYLNVISERIEILSQLTEELFQYTVAASVFSSAKAEEDMEAEREPGKIEIKADLSEGRQRENVAEDLGGLIEESVLASYAALIQSGINPDVELPEEKVKCKINAKNDAQNHRKYIK